MAPSPDDSEQVLQEFIERHLLPAPGFVGLVLVGSRAHGEARPNSDVDVFMVFEDVDERAVPGEFIWDADADSFHSIFDFDAEERRAVQVDAIGRRVSYDEFSTQEWSEPLKHDLSYGRVVVQRGRDLAGLIARRTAYPDDLRVERLAEAIGRAEYHLTSWRLDRWAQRGGWLAAHDQVDAAFEELIAALHAFNRVWMPWRYRRLLSLLKLPWVPANLHDHIEALQTSASRDPRSLQRRADHVRAPLQRLVEQVEAAQLGSQVRAAATVPFSGLGFASTMEEWRRAHHQWRREEGLG